MCAWPLRQRQGLAWDGAKRAGQGRGGRGEHPESNDKRRRLEDGDDIIHGMAHFDVVTKRREDDHVTW